MTMYLHLAGSTHCAGQRILQSVKAGNYELMSSNLFLVREPHNQYDSNAVQVWWRNGMDEVRLGYVDKEQAPDVARYIDKGWGVHITGHSIYGTAESFCGLYMTAEMGTKDSVRREYMK